MMDIQKKGSSGLQARLLKSVIGDFYQEGKFYKIPFGRLKGIKLFYRKDINIEKILCSVMFFGIKK